jgi:hypothetical protein
MSKFFLTFNLIILGINPLIAQDTTSAIVEDSVESIYYPGKPLLMSLILPGAGQFYNKSPWLRTASFLSVEIGSIAAYFHFDNQASQYRNDYKAYADKNWALADWVYNRFDLGMAGEWSNFPALLKLSGTHELTLVLSGSLKEEFGEFVSSDSLDFHLDWIDSGNISVVTDRHFYENIGKYDQFLGGWADARNDWYWEEKDVGDSIEIVIKTPIKEDYLDQRELSNKMLTLAKYSLTTLLFNHVISGLEAVWTSQKVARENNNVEAIETDLSLIYNPINPGGIGGLSLTINF